jgi:putative hydrolase of the HAD superfamily
MKFENISAVIFDLDGTLTDYDASSEAGLREALKIFNLNRDRPLDWKTFSDAYNAVIESESVWTGIHGLSTSAKETRIQRFKTLLQSLGLPLVSNVLDMAEAYGAGRSKGARLYPDVLQTLQYLENKYSMAILTEGSEKTQKEQIKTQNIQSYFSKIIVSGETPWHKPSLSLFEFAVLQMDCEPQNVVMVGDRLDWDIKPAGEVGMKTVFIDRKKIVESREIMICEPDVVIHNLAELIEML